MLIQILYYIGVFSFYLWFVWPFLFVFCLAYGITDLVKGTKKPPIKLVLAGIWLLLILCSLWAPTFQNSI